MAALVVAVIGVTAGSAAGGSSWSSVPSPSPGTAGNVLNGVAAISAADVWAVGASQTTTSNPTLIQHWDGTSWSVTPSPTPGAGQLNAVAAVAANDVWAAGSSWGSDPASRTLVEHWDGASWTVVPSPNPTSPQNSILSGIAAVSANDVWAVGDSYGDLPPGTGPPPPLIEHWDGTAWSIVRGPTQAAGGTLLGVAAASATDVWAVGACPACKAGTLVEHWDGTAWSIVPSPTLGQGARGVVNAVLARSATDVWAVGKSVAYPEAPRTLIEHWDGKRWRVLASPTPSTAYGSDTNLTGVAAGAAGEVWAVGYARSYATNQQYQTLTERWDGTSWSIVASPTPGLAAKLNGVAGLAGGGLWAVGASSANGTDYYGNLVLPQTLVLQR